MRSNRTYSANLGFTLIATALLFPIFFLMTGGQ